MTAYSLSALLDPVLAEHYPARNLRAQFATDRDVLQIVKIVAEFDADVIHRVRAGEDAALKQMFDAIDAADKERT